MQTAYTVHGFLKNRNTIELEEPLPVKDGRITVTIMPEKTHVNGKRKAGAWKGRLSLSPDFDAPLSDFKEYME